MGRFTNKTVIITGGARGIGYGIATAFAKEGANLVLTSIVQEELDNAKQTLEEEYGVKVLALYADGGDYSQVQTAVKNTVDSFGGIDVLINNAQASKSGVLFADHSVEDFKLAIHSGLYAAFYYMKECFPYLKQSKQPRVINFASAAGVYGNMGQTSYAAAKEGIRGMSRVAAREWGELGITVNIICPLAMTEQLAKWAEAEPEMAKANLKNITLGYTFPNKWTRKAYINRLRVYGTAQNLFCLTKYSGYDPEVNMKSSPLMPGFDWGAYPKSRVFTFGVEVQF